MTTSFANATKGRLPQALQASATALVLAIASLAMIVWCWLSVYYGRLCWVERPPIFVAGILALVCGLSALEWVVRVTWFLSHPSI